ncbi:hypothetical protein Q3G72_026954 [Acer saccharum]|nr:hypothetical protein Q3G72_026954 [Acer saccharum]
MTISVHDELASVEEDGRVPLLVNQRAPVKFKVGSIKTWTILNVKGKFMSCSQISAYSGTAVSEMKEGKFISYQISAHTSTTTVSGMDERVSSSGLRFLLSSNEKLGFQIFSLRFRRFKQAKVKSNSLKATDFSDNFFVGSIYLSA